MIIAVINQKGGVGKTTCTVNLGAELSRRGYKILLVDADAQGNLSQATGCLMDDNTPTLFEVLDGKVPVQSAIQHRAMVGAGLDVLPADISLASADLSFASVIGRETLMKRAIAPVVGNYDYVFIDCAPSLSLLTVMSLAAADSVLIPTQTQYFALKGLDQLINTLQEVEKTINPDLFIGGVIVTLYHPNRTVDREAMHELKEAFDDLLYQTTVTQAVALTEATGHGVDIGTYAPASKSAAQYSAIADEFLKHVKEGGFRHYE